MPAAPSRLTTTYSEARARIYRLLLSSPTRLWTVRGLTESLGSEPRVPAEAVRAAVNVLLADKLLVTVTGQRALTARLTDHGKAALRAILESWASCRQFALPA